MSRHRLQPNAGRLLQMVLHHMRVGQLVDAQREFEEMI